MSITGPYDKGPLLERIEFLETALAGRTLEANALRAKLARVLEANDQHYAKIAALEAELEQHAAEQASTVECVTLLERENRQLKRDLRAEMYGTGAG